MIGPHFKSAMFLFNCNSVLADHWNVEVDEFEYEFDSFSKMCCPCVGAEDNVNFTYAQEKLLFWNWKLASICIR